MDAQVVKCIVVGVVAFSIFGVVPVIMALLSHQQKMTELFAKQGLHAAELNKRIEMLERRLAAMPQSQDPLAFGETVDNPNRS